MSETNETIDTSAEKECSMMILDHSGDRRIIWRRSSKAETTDAREEFRGAIEKGYLAFRVNDRGSKAEQIHEFDSSAEEIILTPPVVGG